MNEITEQIATGVVARLTGPVSLRFMLQPSLAILLGVRDGRLDALAGTPPLIFDLVFRPAGRKRAIRSALDTLLFPMVIGSLLDAVAQYLIFQRVRVLAAVLVGSIVVGFPYSLARGLSDRIFSALRRRLAGPAEHPQEEEQ